MSPGSSCHEHRVSLPLSNLQQQQQRQSTLMGSRLTVLWRAHVEAITADVSRMQICSKWLRIRQSFDLLHPSRLALYPCPSNPLCLRLCTLQSRLSSSNPSNALTHSFHLSLSPGACGEGFGLLSWGSEGSFLLWAVWQAVPQTPGVWQPHQLLRPCT